MIKNIGTGKAIGKIILIGEHSVVYNQPAIAIPFLSVRIKTKVSASASEIYLDTFMYKGNISDAPKSLLGLTTVIKKALADLNKPLDKLKIEVESNVPAERGMGSSAAVSASAIRAIYDYYQINLDKQTLTDLVDISEKIVHGNASGIDTAIVVNEKPLYFIKGQPLTGFTYSLDAYLIVADTGVKGNTKFAVSKVKDFIDDNPKLGNTYVSTLGSLSDQAKAAITNNDSQTLANTMNKAQELLSKLGVSSPEIEKLIKVSLDNGALASKLTGGGLGGCVITLCKNKENANKVSKALLKNGATNTWIMNMSDKKDVENESKS